MLPLTGVTHMASQEEVAENLLLLQLAFLATPSASSASRDTDGLPPPSGDSQRGVSGTTQPGLTAGS